MTKGLCSEHFTEAKISEPLLGIWGVQLLQNPHCVRCEESLATLLGNGHLCLNAVCVW
jgi:hypothetical protein